LGGIGRREQLAHEGVPPVVIQRQLGHANRGITSQGIDSAEIIHTVRGRPSPVVPATAELQIRAKSAKRGVGWHDWLALEGVRLSV
jgi:metal-dependent amidase/aminoacylase/carboxypeptidase family protein